MADDFTPFKLLHDQRVNMSQFSQKEYKVPLQHERVAEH